MSFDIIGTGSSAPGTVVDNDNLSTFLETNDEWITTRTGIKTRHIMKDETILSMALEASKQALSQAGISPEALDLIIFSTLQGDYMTPSASCLLQHELGASCPAFDINAACSGFLYGMDVAMSYFCRGEKEHILVVASEGMSQLVDWTDRETCVLFGDGAGAAVLRKGDAVKSIFVGAEGRVEPLNIPGTVGNSPFAEDRKQQKMILHMNGKEVFRFAVGAIVKNLRDAVEKAGLALSDIDWIIPHQANIRLISSAANQLKLPIDKFLMNIDKYGNTSSASIPMILDEAHRDGRIKKGQRVAFVAFGGGLTTGACVLEWKI